MCCFFIFDQSSLHQKQELEALTCKLKKLELQKKRADIQKKEFTLQVASQGDPEYIEMLLMRKLGLIREGQTKVLFVPYQEELAPVLSQE